MKLGKNFQPSKVSVIKCIGYLCKYYYNNFFFTSHGHQKHIFKPDHRGRHQGTLSHSFHTVSHLPLVLLRVALELDQPVLLAVTHGTVVHGDDDGPSQQGPGRPAAHHRAQHGLAIIHWRPEGTHTQRKHTHTHKENTHRNGLFSGQSDSSQCEGYMAELTGVNIALGCSWNRQQCIPHVVLPLNRHIHLIHPALRNRPRWNQQTHP